jgi:hypothetical protein
MLQQLLNRNTLFENEIHSTNLWNKYLPVKAQSSKCGPLSLETPLSESFQFRQLICKLSKIRQVVKHKLGFE